MIAFPLKTFFCAASVLVCLCMTSAASQGVESQPGIIIFCKSLSAEGKAIGPGSDFTTNTVAMVALFSEQCKTTKVLFTIYKKESSLQNLVFREEMQVDPAWNNVLSQELPLPGTGSYTLSFMRPDGVMLASGSVSIVSEKPAPPMPEKMVMEGRTLPELFNHFKSQADKK